MPANTFGEIFRLTTFGESHGTAIGGVVDGCPAGVRIGIEDIQRALDRRRPGQSSITSPRQEPDRVELLSGVYDGMSTGAPIAFIIRNADARSSDYDQLKDVYRPSHADYTYEQKYGMRDHRGGGRSSARETACRVAGGAIAMSMLRDSNISVSAFVKQVGSCRVESDYDALDLSLVDSNPVRCPDRATATRMEALIASARDAGDTLGGVVQCVIRNLNAGLGEPVYDRFHAVLAHAMLSINAAKGFEIGSGFAGAARKGSEENDAFENVSGSITTRTNNSGGVQGGITNGMDVYFNVAFKPVSTLKVSQDTVDRSGQPAKMSAAGRHDPCVLPRAVPVVEAMAALVTADMLLRSRSSKLKP